ncbi:MAG: DUF4830 domain-containing protein [Clostridia bacterium]|nr:DUF4830 domain-containing protein [Clostridia bacterium]
MNVFVVSVKRKEIKYYAAAALICLFAVIGGIVSVSQSASLPAAKVGGVNMRAGNAEERIAFFSQFGWEISTDPLEVKEVVIPAEFDETYEEYNALQKSQGLDLSKYKGKRAKFWSYEIKNYPGYENTDSVIHGNILVYEGIVIGGDICSVELDGFMVGFTADN